MSYFTDTTLAESSVKLYNNRLQKWLSMTPHKNILRLLAFHKESYDVLLKGLTEKDNTATNRHMYLSAVTALFKHSPATVSQLPAGIDFNSVWQNLMVKNSESIRERRLENKPTIAQEKKEGSALTFEDVCKMRDSLPNESIDKLLLAFYTFIPCLRADLFATQIICGENVATHSNFICLTDKSASLVVTDFKSKSKYKKIEHPSLPQELFSLLSLSIKDKPRGFLFVDDVGDPFTRAGFSNWVSRRLTKLFNVNKVTLTLLRHIYVNSLDMNMATKELEKISRLMGHSLMTQRSYKWIEAQEDSEECETIKNEVLQGSCCVSNTMTICNSCNTITMTSHGGVTQISLENKEAYKEALIAMLKKVSSMIETL